jgi:predicted tellurium resistance membrane protein TerC
MELFTTEALVSLLTLTVLEIILGIDNIVFISILAGRVPPAKQAQTRQLGLFIGMGIRILLLMAISWIMRLDEGLFTVFNQDISGKDLILIGGGLFLLYQSTKEIHEKLEGAEGDNAPQSGAAYGYIILQLAIINVVFSLDSVITAIGMADLLWVMITAVILSVAVMFFAAKPIGDFVNKHPTVKILALSFLFLIGVSLIAEGFHQHISKGYIYFAMAFSFAVELVNLRFRKKSKPVKLHDKYTPAS